MKPYSISLLVTLLVVSGSGLAQAQVVLDCSSPQGESAARGQIEASLQSIRQDQKLREAEIDRELETRGAANKWSKEQKSKIFFAMLSSPKFAAFEKEKRPYTTEVMGIVMSGPPPGQKPDPKKTCADGLRLKILVDKIKDINARQYTFMLNEVKAAK